MGINEMSCEEWDQTFGRVYKELIDEGVMTVMGRPHRAAGLFQEAAPRHQDTEIRPATLAPELITDLLKGQLGFNGLVVTDASHMIGMFGATIPRSEQVPGAIAAGCDMFLFFNDRDEDFGYMMEGYKNGTITEERLNDALAPHLGVKAALNLHILQKGRQTAAAEGKPVGGGMRRASSAVRQAGRPVCDPGKRPGRLPAHDHGPL